MADYGHELTEKQLKTLENRIAKIYKEAAKDVKKAADEYFANFAIRDREQKALLDAGEITKQEYAQWRLAQMGRGERYQALANSLAERMTKANEVAVAYVNDATPSIYSLNRNWTAYTIESVAGDVGFNVWDEATVRRLIVDRPDVMPYYPPKRAVNRGIDLKYGKKQITAQITSSILKGDDLKGIVRGLTTKIPTMNLFSAIRTARTATTAAQNGGRLDSMMQAEKMGLRIKKEWMATHDGRVRHEHAMLDGQQVDLDEPFKIDGYELDYPGDPTGEPEMVYNCRCTMVQVLVDVPEVAISARLDFSEWLQKEQHRKGIDGHYEVSAYVRTSLYSHKFQSMGENKKVTRVMRSQTKAILKHRNGTYFEDLVYINRKTGKYIKRDDYNKPREVIPSKRMIKMAIKNPGDIIAIHNHPGSSLPSLVDIKSCLNGEYAYGIIAAHNGKLFKYSVRCDNDYFEKNADNIEFQLVLANKSVYNKSEDALKTLDDSLKTLMEMGVYIEEV